MADWEGVAINSTIIQRIIGNEWNWLVKYFWVCCSPWSPLHLQNRNPKFQNRHPPDGGAEDDFIDSCPNRVFVSSSTCGRYVNRWRCSVFCCRKELAAVNLTRKSIMQMSVDRSILDWSSPIAQLPVGSHSIRHNEWRFHWNIADMQMREFLWNI